MQTGFAARLFVASESLRKAIVEALSRKPGKKNAWTGWKQREKRVARNRYAFEDESQRASNLEMLALIRGRKVASLRRTRTRLKARSHRQVVTRTSRERRASIFVAIRSGEYARRIRLTYRKRRSAVEDRRESPARENSWELGKRCSASSVPRLHFQRGGPMNL